MAENVIVVQFPDSSKCYEFFSWLKRAGADGGLTVGDAVVIVRDADGRYQVQDGQLNTVGVGTRSGSLIGMLVGILGGPLGMLFGWGAGSLIGAAVDAGQVAYIQSAIAQVSQSIPTGGTAVIALVNETNDDPVNAQVAQMGGAVLRWSAEDVKNEIAAHAEAQAAADREARRVLSEQHAAERKQKIEEWKDHAKGELDKIKAFLNRDIA